MEFFYKDVRYHVELFGNGKPLLMLHGFTGNGNSFRFFSENVSHRKIIAPDLIGHGKTDIPEDISHYHIEEQAAMLAHLLDLMEIVEIDVHGYSMGGRLAITFALLYPEKVSRLILESTTPGIKTAQERNARKQNDQRISHRIEEKGIKDFVNYWENIPLFASQKKLTEQKQSEIRAQRLQNAPQGLINSLTGMGTGAQPNWWSSIAKLQIPVLILVGSYDEKFCLIGEEMSQLIRQATFKIIEQTGHTIHAEKPRQFVSEVEKFLLETSTY